MTTKTKKNQDANQGRLINVAMTYAFVESHQPSKDLLQFIKDMKEHDHLTRYMCFTKYISAGMEDIYTNTKDERIKIAINNYAERFKSCMHDYIQGRININDFDEDADGAEEVLLKIFKH